jgi:hypothetical protein
MLAGRGGHICFGIPNLKRVPHLSTSNTSCLYEVMGFTESRSSSKLLCRRYWRSIQSQDAVGNILFCCIPSVWICNDVGSGVDWVGYYRSTRLSGGVLVNARVEEYRLSLHGHNPQPLIHRRLCLIALQLKWSIKFASSVGVNLKFAISFIYPSIDCSRFSPTCCICSWISTIVLADYLHKTIVVSAAGKTDC